MDIWNIDKLALVLMFAIPGFLMLKTSSVLSLEPSPDSSKLVIDAVAYSCINFALLAFPIFLVETSQLRSDSPRLYFAFYTLVLLVAPVFWAVLWRLIRATELLQKYLPHPTSRPWDYVFGKRPSYWVVVTYKDGKQIAGLYQSRSFASAAPSPEQIFLEEAWVLSESGGFERKRHNTEGVLVLGSEVRSLEFFTHTKEHLNAAVESSPQP